MFLSESVRLNVLGFVALCILSCLPHLAVANDLPFDYSETPDDWFRPQDSRELIYVGELPDDGKTNLKIDLKRSSVSDHAIAFWVQSDAEAIELNAGTTSLTIAPTGVAFDQEIVLSGDASRPAIMLDQTPLPAVRGRWIRMLHREEGPIHVEFVQASYANLFLYQDGQAQTAAPPHPAHRATTSQGYPPPQPTMYAGESPLSPTAERMAMGAAGSLQNVMGPGPRSTPAVEVVEQQQPPQDQPTTGTLADRTNVKVVRHVDRDGASSAQVNSGEKHLGSTPGDYEQELYGPQNKLHLNVDFGSMFPTAYFYRGFGRENQDLIVQPFLGLDASLFRGVPERDGTLGQIISDISLHADIIGTFANGPFGSDTYGEAWTEVIFKAGGSITFFDRLTFMTEYENVESIHTNYRDVHQVNFGFSFDDSDPEYPFSLQPYMLFSWEVEDESDGGWLSQANDNNPIFKSGLYLEVGIEPEVELIELWMKEPVTVSFPAKIGFSLFDYYQDPTGSDDFFGYGSIGAMFHVPLFELPATGGRGLLCTFDAGVEFLFLGASARRLSEAVGTGDSNFVPIGKFAINFWY